MKNVNETSMIASERDVQCRCDRSLYTEIGDFVEECWRRPSKDAPDWRLELASWMVELFVDTKLKDRVWPQVLGVDSSEARAWRQSLLWSINLLLSQMVGPASMACEIARRKELSGERTNSLLSGNERHDFEVIDSRVELPTNPTVGDILERLCLILFDALQARDDYNYDRLLKVLNLCDEMPLQFKQDDFTAFGCLSMVARAGKSRTSDGSQIQGFVLIDEWQQLSDTVLENSSTVHAQAKDSLVHQCMAYPLLVLVSAIGHTRRQHSAKLNTDVIELIVHNLRTLEGCVSADEDSDVSEFARHHILYYWYFVEHVLAIKIGEVDPASDDFPKLMQALGDVMPPISNDVQAMPKSSQNGRDHDRAAVWYQTVLMAYERAAVSIEGALSSVPPISDARRDYYELTGENLEHEMSLRLELMSQRMAVIEAVRKHAKYHVSLEVSAAKEEMRGEMSQLHNEMRSISMRVIEIIGVFLAIVAFLGTTVVSGTAGELEVGERILILCVGGVISLLFFVLLRLIVVGPGSKGMNEDGDSKS